MTPSRRGPRAVTAYRTPRRTCPGVNCRAVPRWHRPGDCARIAGTREVLRQFNPSHHRQGAAADRPMLLVAVIGVVLGTIYLELLHVAFGVLWGTIPDSLAAQDLLLGGYILVMLTAGAALVGLLRNRTNLYGHSPLDGLKVTPSPVRTALRVVRRSGHHLALRRGAWSRGGACWRSAPQWGPGGRTVPRVTPPDDRLESAGPGRVLGAVCALVVSLGAHGTLTLPAPQLSLVTDLLGAAVVSLAAALLAAIVRCRRLSAAGLGGWAHDPGRPDHLGRIRHRRGGDDRPGRKRCRCQVGARDRARATSPR